MSTRRPIVGEGREEHRFKSPWSLLLAPPLRRWFEADTAKEMERFQKTLGKPDAADLLAEAGEL